jgi:hypothetical protein
LDQQRTSPQTARRRRCRRDEATAKTEGIAIKTLRRAKKALKIKSKQVPDKWLWVREGLDGQGEKGGHLIYG